MKEYKRDILDDFTDFMRDESGKAVVQLKPKVAKVDKDGDVEFHMELILHYPGIGSVYGGAICWFPQDFFPHLEYSEPCTSEIAFKLFDPSADDDESNIDVWLQELDL